MLEGNKIHESLKQKGALKDINLTVPEAVKYAGRKVAGLTEWVKFIMKCNNLTEEKQNTKLLDLKTQTFRHTSLHCTTILCTVDTKFCSTIVNTLFSSICLKIFLRNIHFAMNNLKITYREKVLLY